MSLYYPTYRLEIVVTDAGSAFYPPVGTKESLSDQNAGYDLKVVVDQPSTQVPVLVPLGVKVRMVRMTQYAPHKALAIEEDSHFTLEPRSSIFKSGFFMANSRGIIDKSYRGELKAPMVSLPSMEKSLEAGTRLFQILAPEMGYIESVEYVKELPETVRGEGGFGSTGLK